MNGTSLPSAAATCASSSRPISSFHRFARPTSVAAASALPPAMPPDTGMPLRIRTRTLGSSAPLPTRRDSSSTARQARVAPSVGTPDAPSPRTSTPGSSAIATVTSSVSDSDWKTVATSWKPSLRTAPTARCRFTLDGTRTVTGRGTTASTSSAYGQPSPGRPLVKPAEAGTRAHRSGGHSAGAAGQFAHRAAAFGEPAERRAGPLAGQAEAQARDRRLADAGDAAADHRDLRAEPAGRLGQQRADGREADQHDVRDTGVGAAHGRVDGRQHGL